MSSNMKNNKQNYQMGPSWTVDLYGIFSQIGFTCFKDVKTAMRNIAFKPLSAKLEKMKGWDNQEVN